jgi:hypothetical protein
MKLNLVKQGGVMLAYSVVAGQLIGRTKEAIQNLATGRNDSNYDLFDDNGEIDLGVLGSVQQLLVPKWYLMLMLLLLMSLT